MLMGSFDSSHHRPVGQQEADQEDDPVSDLHHRPPFTSPPNVLHARQLLIRCAQLISNSDFSSAHRLLALLSSNSSPYGDSTERLVHHFSKALSHRLSRTLPAGGEEWTSSSSLMNFPADHASSSSAGIASCAEASRSCYLSLNQMTPFLRFSHLTANQAILEAVEQGHHRAIHIIDLDLMHGVQWPPLMQALADRHNNNANNNNRTLYVAPLPVLIRITAPGHDSEFLRRTGERLSKFAQSLGVGFEFHAILVRNDRELIHLLSSSSSLAGTPDEALVVNCVLYLHKLSKDDLGLFLHAVKSLCPRVVTVAEREAKHDNPLFIQRFVEAIDHYSAIFESLEATLPANSMERMSVESVWLGKEIMDVVGIGGERIRRLRHERFETWEVMMRRSGFRNIPLSPFALSQAKLLLRLHYPSEGYHLHILNDAVFLGWKNRPLFSVSSWH